MTRASGSMGFEKVVDFHLSVRSDEYSESIHEYWWEYYMYLEGLGLVVGRDKILIKHMGNFEETHRRPMMRFSNSRASSNNLRQYFKQFDSIKEVLLHKYNTSQKGHAVGRYGYAFGGMRQQKNVIHTKQNGGVRQCAISWDGETKGVVCVMWYGQNERWHRPKRRTALGGVEVWGVWRRNKVIKLAIKARYRIGRRLNRKHHMIGPVGRQDADAGGFGSRFVSR